MLVVTADVDVLENILQKSWAGTLLSSTLLEGSASIFKMIRKKCARFGSNGIFQDSIRYGNHVCSMHLEYSQTNVLVSQQGLCHRFDWPVWE
jgi:hypothetical protein